MISRGLSARLAFAAAVAISVAPLSSASAETRSFVVDWLTLAMHSEEGDCPGGENPGIEDMFRGIFRGMGYPPEKIEDLMVLYNGGSGVGPIPGIVVYRGRIDGKPVNVYDNPTSVPDPNIHTVAGRYSPGFDLDGKAEPGSFEDPETREKGVDNQFYRAMGCVHSHRATPPHRAGYWSYAWDAGKSVVRAWLITVTGDDLNRDGKVTVTFNRGMSRVIRDANSQAQRDQTFKTDPDPRTQSSFRGQIKDGLVTIEPGELHMITGGAYLPLQWDMQHAHLRLKLKPDGSAEGVLGGYQPWLQLYYMYGIGGYGMEGMIGVNIPGTYYALRKLADADLDPKTGQNMSISAAYRIEAVPAFTIPASQKRAAADSLVRP